MKKKNEDTSESIKPINQNHSQKTVYKKHQEANSPHFIKNIFDKKK